MDYTVNEQGLLKNQNASRIAVVFAWILMIIFALHACTHMIGAGDTWVAMACGRHFTNHGVDTVEPFSANSRAAGPTSESMAIFADQLRDGLNSQQNSNNPPNGLKTAVVTKWAEIADNYANWPDWTKSIFETVHPTGWTNQNWLTHVFFYQLTPKSSYTGDNVFDSNLLVYWKFGLYIVTIVFVYFLGRIMGVHRLLSAVLACLALFVGRTFLDIRPAGFSNLFTAVLLVILALSIYANYKLIWLIVPLIVFWANLHGGYIYFFIVMVPFIALQLFRLLDVKWTAILYGITAVPFLLWVYSQVDTAALELEAMRMVILQIILLTAAVIITGVLLIFFKEKLTGLNRRGLLHTIGAVVAAFFAMIILNPFRLTNLTHTFVVSISQHAELWRTVNEWHGAFEFNNPVGSSIPFLVMYIIGWTVLVSWIAVLSITSDFAKKIKRKPRDKELWQWPKIDIGILAISIFTVYLAVRSRRFIPVAAIAMAPFIGLFVQDIIKAVSSVLNYKFNHKFEVPAIPRKLKMAPAIVFGIAILFFGSWWGTKFYRVYLAPWPRDYRLTSIFMRMTASDSKPFYATEFIRDNDISGKMFNYWTEGGFIAWGQDPDEETGRTPLQLFMDGRAQAAYEPEDFIRWSNIFAGGPAAQNAYVRGQSGLTGSQFREMGQFVSEQLRKDDVWIILMPDTSSTTKFTTAMQYTPDWPLVYIDNHQKIFVDIKSEQGRQLYQNIYDLKFPNEFIRNLTLGFNLLSQGESGKNQKGLDFAMAAQKLEPDRAPAQLIGYAYRYPELQDRIISFCESEYSDFMANKDEYKNQHGFLNRLISIQIVTNILHHHSLLIEDKQSAEHYKLDMEAWGEEMKQISKEMRW